jgi:phosphoenolpyruvate-protein kinase (PTS system EI component)
MRPPARFRGVPVSPGRAAGVLRVAGDDAEVSAAPEEVAAAFAAVSAQRMELAGKLRAAGRADDAAVIEVSGLIAADPALTVPAVEAVRGGEAPAAAVRAAAGRQAAAMEQLSNPELAERAGDIRQIAAAVVDFLRTSPGDSAASAPVPGVPFILVRPEVSPAELIELADAGLAGAVSVSGGGSSHAAIIARGLGVPMISSADPAVLTAPSGVPAALDADMGELLIHPVNPANPGSDRDCRSYSTGNRDQTLVGPVRTADGTEITVLCNVASVPETRRGLAAGAAGVGLLRTEIPYTREPGWPTLAQQRAQLGPILAMLPGKTATVRLLDFSGDKIPPFLDGPGLAALLSHPTALADQLRAILQAGRDTRLGILIPMVRALDEITRVREVLTWVAADTGGPVPPLGIMVELAATAARAADFAAAVDFFSIGTNDLAGDVLGLTRDDPAAGPGLAADPRILTLVRQVADAGRDAGIGVSVCGDAAADLSVLPLLIAAGIRTVSVAAARVSSVRSGIGGLRG